jgi:UDP-glucose 4-epimerase
MALCLVTGGAGFIGSHLVEGLVKRGDAVRVLDNFSTGALSNLDHVRRDVELVLGDLGDHELLSRACDGVELLFHLAFPPWSTDAPPDLLAAKWAYATETLQVLIAARAAGVGRVVYASCGAVYGNPERGVIDEDSCVLPESSYGFAKLAGEMQCMGFNSLHGLETVRLRYSNTFGPRQSTSSPVAHALTQVVKAMCAGQAPRLDEFAEEQHDFIYVDDVVHATLLAAEAPRVSGQVFNIARGRSTTMLAVVDAVNELLGTHLIPTVPKAGLNETAARAVDITRAERVLGFCPSIDLRQGLLRLIEHYAEAEGRALPETVARERRGPHHPELRSEQPSSEIKTGDVGV